LPGFNDDRGECLLSAPVGRLYRRITFDERLSTPISSGSPTMTKKTENRPQAEDRPQEPALEAPAAARTPAAITIDDSSVIACYSNFCRVSSTPEELVLDLGLNPQPLNPNVTNVKVSQRIILNHFTAKRMLMALSAAIQRHEQAFGALEIDVRKRIQQA
jgi:hypothetical protein